MKKNVVTVAFLINGESIPTWQDELLKTTSNLENIHVQTVTIPKEFSPVTTERRRDVKSFFLNRREVKRDAMTTAKNSCFPATAVPLQDTGRKATGYDLLVNMVSAVDGNILSDMLGIPVWIIAFGKGEDIESPLAVAEEVLNRDPLSTLYISEFTPGVAKGRLLVKASSITHTYSPRLTATQLAWKAVYYIQKLLQNKTKRCELPIKPQQPLTDSIESKKQKLSYTFVPSKETQFYSPTFFFWLISRLRDKIREKFYFDQWVLLTGKHASNGNFPKDLKMIYPPADRQWADPFGFEYENRMFVFFEDMPFSTNKGHISCADVNNDGSLGQVTPIIEHDYHLSYPFLFQVNNNLFLIPESGQNRTIDLYRCNSFPHSWKFVCTLMQGVEAWDTTILESQGLWWLFTNMAPIHGIASYDQLHLYYSTKFPSEDWTAHPMNPIIDNVQLSRPAGKIFTQDNVLVRPSQFSNRYYGEGLNFNEITALTPESYGEKLQKRYISNQVVKKLFALHTYNRSGNTCFMDGKLFLKKSNANGKPLLRAL